MKDITLKITGKLIDENFEEEQLRFVTEGKLYRRGDALVVIYEESEVSGMPGCKTSLKLKGDTLHMKRFGKAAPADTVIEFEKGKKYTGYYDTPFGAFEMEVLTNSVSSDIRDDGKGEINVDYHMSLGGIIDNRNLLCIEIS